MTKSEELAKLAEQFSISDQKFDTQFRDFEIMEKEGAISKGREDGTQNTPSESDLNLSPVEQGIINAFQAKLNQYEGVVKPYLVQLRDKYIIRFQQRLKDLAAEDISEELYKVRKERNSKIEEAKKQRDAKLMELKDGPILLNYDQDYKDARARYEHLCLSLGRRVTNSQLSLGVYFIIMIFVAFAEIFVNYTVFETFGESKLMTWIAVFAVGAVIALAAHFIGKLIKRYQFKHIGVWVSLSIALITLLGMSYGIASLRSEFIIDINERISDTAIFASWIIFFCSALIFLGVGIVSSWFHYDSSLEFSAAKKEYEEAKKNFNFEIERIANQKREIHETYQKNKRGIENEYENWIFNVEDEDEILKNLIQIAISEYNAILHEAQATEKMINSALKETISDYRNENKRVRPKDKMPSVWNDLPSLLLHFQTYPLANNLMNDEPNLN
jgi:hypothetical protein